MIQHNKQGNISEKYLLRIGFIEESRGTYILRKGELIIIFCNANLYFSIKGKSKKSELFANCNYKNIEDNIEKLIYAYG